jgi:hypothetical protein
MIKSIILYLVLLIGIHSKIISQNTDCFKVSMDLSIAALPLDLSGTMDVGEGSSTIIDNTEVVSEPIYRHKELSGLVLNSIVHLGGNIPLYKNYSWSVGVKLFAGVGLQYGVRNSEGLNSYVFDFPEYIYYRNYATAFDFSVLLGYKYTRASLPYHLLLAAFDINIDDNNSIRLFSSFSKYTYYELYTNGNLRPMLKITELGIVYTYILDF